MLSKSARITASSLSSGDSTAAEPWDVILLFSPVQWLASVHEYIFLWLFRIKINLEGYVRLQCHIVSISTKNIGIRTNLWLELRKTQERCNLDFDIDEKILTLMKRFWHWYCIIFQKCKMCRSNCKYLTNAIFPNQSCVAEIAIGQLIRTWSHPWSINQYVWTLSLITVQPTAISGSGAMVSNWDQVWGGHI